MKHHLGFTLIELLVTMFILIIITLAAAPAFTGVMQNVDIDSSVSKIRSSLTFARSLAVSEQEDVTICSSSDETTCTGETDWAAGWLVYIDFDGDNAADADEIQRVWDGLPTGATLVVEQTSPAGGISTLDFEPNGSIDTAAAANMINFVLEVQNCDVGDQRTINVNAIGRINVATGDC